jgi:glutathione S-transferase
MIVFGSSLSPYVRKVLVFAAEKGIEVESRMVQGPDPEFQAASPFGKIPALKDGDFNLADSSAIVAYLEKLKPEPNLIPGEPRAHGRTIWYDEFGDTILCAAGVPIFFNRIVAPLLGREPDLAAADRAEREALPPVLAHIETVAPATFLVEDRFTLADISMVSPFVNLMHLGLGPDAKTHPKTAAYVERILARPSFAALLAGEKAFLKQAA